MFQSRQSSTDPNPTNANPQTALPNNYGKIRTLKKDYDDFKSGKFTDAPADDFVSAPKVSIPQPVASEQKPPAPHVANMPPPASQPVHSEPPKNTAPAAASPMAAPNPSAAPQMQAPLSGKPTVGKTPGIPNPFGTDSFYQEPQPSFENIGEELKKNAKAASGKSSKLLLWLLAVLIILAAGGGGYYWWFYMRTPSVSPSAGINSSQNTEKSSATVTPSTESANTSSPTAATSTSQNQNGKVRQWSIDLSSDKIAAKLALKRNITDFISSVADENIIEAKIVSTGSQAVPAKKFEELFDFQLPTAVNSALSDEYSIFVKKENGEARMGGVFKLSQNTGITDSIKNEEANLLAELKSFYLDANLSSATDPFNSSTYGGADIRYFNFSSPANTSLDYSIISGQSNTYFIFATSKGTLHSIIDYMVGK